MFAVLAGVAAALSGTGCGHSPPPAVPAAPGAPSVPPSTAPAAPPCTTPEPLRISLQGSQRLNPGEKGEALAVVVRVYQLKGMGKLQSAAFDDLLDRDKETLGDELLGSAIEVTINPGERLDPAIVRHAEAGYVAAVALFRRPAGNTWRSMRRLPPPDPQHCHPDKKASPPPGPLRFVLDENRIDLR